MTRGALSQPRREVDNAPDVILVKGVGMREPGTEKVSPATRTFELEDAQVFRGAGRGPTPAEEAAAERAGGTRTSTADAYKEMIQRGASQPGEGRPGW